MFFALFKRDRLLPNFMINKKFKCQTLMCSNVGQQCHWICVSTNCIICQENCCFDACMMVTFVGLVVNEINLMWKMPQCKINGPNTIKKF